MTVWTPGMFDRVADLFLVRRGMKAQPRFANIEEIGPVHSKSKMLNTSSMIRRTYDMNSFGGEREERVQL